MTLSLTSAVKTLIQTPPPTSLDTASRLAESGKGGATGNVAAAVGARPSSVVGGLTTNATPYNPARNNPSPERVTAGNLNGGAFLQPQSFVAVAEFAQKQTLPFNTPVKANTPQPIDNAFVIKAAEIDKLQTSLKQEVAVRRELNAEASQEKIRQLTVAQTRQRHVAETAAREAHLENARAEIEAAIEHRGTIVDRRERDTRAYERRSVEIEQRLAAQDIRRAQVEEISVEAARKFREKASAAYVETRERTHRESREYDQFLEAKLARLRADDARAEAVLAEQNRYDKELDQVEAQAQTDFLSAPPGSIVDEEA